jgi:tetratricopeptide (TPR) repeat protein
VARRRVVSLRPSTPRGWGWVRLSTLAGVVTLAVAALTAIGALWMRLADKQHRLTVQLVVGSVVLAVVGFLSAAVGRVAELREKRARQVADWQATVRRLIREFPDGRLPPLSTLPDEAMGPTPTRYTLEGHAPYVKRPTADDRLTALLGASGPPFPFVVVVGRSKAGKSRTAVQAARSLWASQDPVVVVPENGEALAVLMRLDPPLQLEPGSGVVWLDDLTAADLVHLSSDVLDAVTQKAPLIATMTDERWDQVRNSSGDVAATAQLALQRALPMPLRFELTEAEKAEASLLYPQEQVAASIAETLVAGEQLVDKYRAGSETEPTGHAIVQAAVDARRAGLYRPVTDAELRNLYPLYLRRLRIDLDPTDVLFAQGLSWAKKPIASQVALLRPATRSDGWDVLDYVVAVEDGQGGHQPRPVLDQMWQALIAAVTADDAFDIGLGAHLRNNVDATTAAFRKAADSGHPDLAPMAAIALGMLLAGEEGDVAGARAAYQFAIDSANPDAAPMAASRLGWLLAEQGDVAGARAAYQSAIDSNHPDAAPIAAYSLGMLLEHEGDVAGARAAYQSAIDSDHAEAAALATQSIAELDQ